jgi:hypothetical protein
MSCHVRCAVAGFLPRWLIEKMLHTPSNADKSLLSSRDESKKVFFLTFAAPAGATAAVASDGTQFDGVEIAVSLRVDGYTNDPVAVDPCRIFVGRLSSEIDGEAGLTAGC